MSAEYNFIAIADRDSGLFKEIILQRFLNIFKAYSSYLYVTEDSHPNQPQKNSPSCICQFLFLVFYFRIVIFFLLLIK